MEYENDFSKLVYKTFGNEYANWLNKNRGAWTYYPNEPKKTIAEMARALRMNGQLYPEDVSKISKLAVYKGKPTLNDYASAAKISGVDSLKTKPGDEMLKKYFGEATGTDKQIWKDLIEDAYGEGSWNDTKNQLTQALLDSTANQIARDRKNILEGYDENGNAIPTEWLKSALMGVFQPRQKKAFMEGRDPTVAEQGMDAFSGAMYAAPVSGIGKAIAARFGGNFVGRALGALASNSVAPVAVTTADAVTGGKQYANVNDALIDAGLGLATNLGVNKGLAAVGSRILGPAEGSVKADAKALDWLRNALEGKQTDTEIANSLVSTATKRAQKAVKGKVRGTEAEQNQLMDDLIVAEFGRMKKTGELEPYRQKVIQTNARLNEPNMPAVAEGIGKEPLWQNDLQTAILNQNTPEHFLESKVSGNFIGKPTPKPDDNLGTFVAEVPGGDYIVREALRNHPILESLITEPHSATETLRNLLKPNYTTITGKGVTPSVETIKQLQKQVRQNELAELKQQLVGNKLLKTALTPVKDFAVNKLGTDKDASRLINIIPGVDVQGLRKLQEEWHKEQGIE